MRLWRAEDGREIKKLQLSTYADYAVFNPDGSRMLTVAPDSGDTSYLWDVSHLWDVSSGTKVAALRGHKSDTHSGTFSHDGRLAATVSIEGTARLWDSATGELRHVFGEETGMTFADVGVNYRHQDMNGAFSPDDRLFATGSVHGVVRIWDVRADRYSPSSGGIAALSSTWSSVPTGVVFSRPRTMVRHASGTSMVY